MNYFVGLLSNWTIEPFLAFSNDIIYLERFDFELLIAKTVKRESVSTLMFMIESVSIEERALEIPRPPFRIRKLYQQSSLSYLEQSYPYDHHAKPRKTILSEKNFHFRHNCIKY